MGYYKILMADDEAEIRDGMIQKLDWNVLGFEVAASAENGVEALELLEQAKPDVIMTDIKMPFMDGLEFIEKAVEILPTVKIIVFSGFDDFEYAQKAIRLNVEEYLLKPISSAQMTESLINLKKKMDKELEERSDIDRLRKSYLESYPVMREQLISGILERTVPQQQILQKARQYQVDSEKGYRAVVLVAVDREPIVEVKGQISAFTGKEELVPIAIRQIMEAVLGRFHKADCLLHGDFVIGVVQLNYESQISILINEVNEICREGRKVTGMEIAAGIGGVVENLEEISYSYREAGNAVEYSMLKGRSEGGRCVYIKDVEPEDLSGRLQFSETEERAFLTAIKAGNVEKIRKLTSGFFSKLEQSKLPYHRYQAHIFELFTLAMRLSNAYQLDLKGAFGGEANYISTLFGLHSLGQIEEWFMRGFLKLGGMIQKERMDSGKSLTFRAKAFVEEHFPDASLSVERLCEELHVSPAYFSTVFKKETGKSFVSYLTEVRLNEAVRLLDTTSDKTYVIAAKAGYAEPNYFSYVFKKKYGVAPSRYRKQQER